MRPGWQTSEFRLTLATLAGQLAAALDGALSPRLASIISAVVVGVYTVARSFVKGFVGAGVAQEPPVPSSPPVAPPGAQAATGMVSVAVTLFFIGYTLVYAAVANGGKFATEPWQGLVADAYQS